MRASLPRFHPACMPKHVAIAIDLELTQPVSGSVRCEDLDPMDFRGWLQLHSALETICVAAQAGTSFGPTS